MSRRTGRELTFKLLYGMDIQKESSEEVMQLYIQEEKIENEEVKQYIEETIHGIKEHEKEILSLIEKNIKKNWDIQRISKIDLAILKLSIYEINYAKVPYKAAINEAVEIAKKYGEDNSHVFINGVLAEIVKQKEE